MTAPPRPALPRTELLRLAEVVEPRTARAPWPLAPPRARSRNLLVMRISGRLQSRWNYGPIWRKCVHNSKASLRHGRKSKVDPSITSLTRSRVLQAGRWNRYLRSSRLGDGGWLERAKTISIVVARKVA